MPSGRARWRASLAAVLPPVVVVVGTVAAWEVACRAFEIREFVLPAPSLVAWHFARGLAIYQSQIGRAHV